MMLEPRVVARTVPQPLDLAREPGGSVAPLGIDVAEDGDDRFSFEQTQARRLRLTRLVRWTMAACVLLGAAGITRHFVVDRVASADEVAHATEGLVTAGTAVSQASSPPPPAAADIPPPVAIPAAVAPAADPKEAKREKKAAQHALDHNKPDLAIAAATRSAALDATDAETWLVLGAAYLEKHDVVSARHAFADCGKSATHGPKNECAAMLR